MDESVEMGPIDYILVEWPGRQPNGEVAPHLIDLVERGLIRILDLALIAKDEDGTVAGIELADLGDGGTELSVFEGASSGLISDDDLGEAGAALEPAPRPRCSSSRTRGPRPSPRRCAAPAASSSPAAGSRSKPSRPRSTRPSRTPKREEDPMPGLLRG